MRLLSRLLISLGIIFYVLGIYNIWLVKNPNRLAFQKYSYANEVHTEKDAKLTAPVRIIIKKQNIDLPIIPSHIINNEWETTSMGASYLASSPIPGQKGNSVIYAHNWASLFGNLVNVAPGDEVQIQYRDNTIRTFIVKYTSTVAPETYSILNPTTDKRITLYTCTGFMDSHRFVAAAILKNK